MVKRSKESASSYKLWLEPEVHKSRGSFPGNIRQRVKRTIGQLSKTPRPSNSLVLDTADFDLHSSIEIRRIRLERWRIIYAINEVDRWVWVIAIHQRPPYEYGDLPGIVSKLAEKR